MLNLSKRENRMQSPDKTTIELSKVKLALLMVGSFSFAAVGICMLSLNKFALPSVPSYRDYAIGGAGVVFFGLCGVFALIKIFDATPGLIFDENGIVDNASGISAGPIPWSEITGFKIYSVRRQKILLVQVKDPSKYLNRGNWLKKLLINANYKLCGTPVAIPATTLRANIQDIQKLLDAYYQKFGGARSI